MRRCVGITLRLTIPVEHEKAATAIAVGFQKAFEKWNDIEGLRGEVRAAFYCGTGVERLCLCSRDDKLAGGS